MKQRSWNDWVWSHVPSFVKGSGKRAMRTLGFEIRRIEPEYKSCTKEKSEATFNLPYEENPENSDSNVRLKMAEVDKGLPFESPYILGVNRAVAELIGEPESIAELGCGTGIFASEVAKNPSINIVCFEPDLDTYQWAKKHQSRPNIAFLNRPITPDDGPFDLVVSIEVIEHVKDYHAFIETCIQLAPRAILTTPNKKRRTETEEASPPIYYRHVREWTIGEFYWVLRTFYESVWLYGVTKHKKPTNYPIRLTSSNIGSIIAVCESPYTKSIAT